MSHPRIHKLSEPLKSGQFLHLDATFDFIRQKKYFFIKCIQWSSIFNSFLNGWMKALIMNVHENSSTVRQQCMLQMANSRSKCHMAPMINCWLARVLGLEVQRKTGLNYALAFVTKRDISKSYAFVMTIGSFLTQSTSNSRWRAVSPKMP